MTSTRAPLRRVGHKGADLIAPGNTAASFDAALEAGVDMIEFDVLPERAEDPEAGGLFLAHDYRDLAGRERVSLDEGLAHLAGSSFRDVEIDVDLKLPGYELRVVEALRAHGLLDRTLISTMYRESLARIRAAAPGVRLGWSLPRVRRDPFTSPLLVPPAWLGLQAIRIALPRTVGRALREGACDAAMVQWRLVTPRLVSTVRRAGGDLYVWTVDDRERIRRLERLGVTGVITNDPRLFV